MTASTIVVGFVDTAEGKAALELAVAEARLRQARLIVVHSMMGGDKTDAEDVLTYRAALDATGAELEAAGLEFEIHEYVRGQDPSEDVVQAAKEFGASLLVIGLRRRTPTGKWLLGSTAQEILLDAPCPVLAVHAS